jgi:hypothetical protein
MICDPPALVVERCWIRGIVQKNFIMTRRMVTINLDDNAMPFAVDSYSGSTLADKGAASENNSLLASASGVASFATAPPKRLALFDSVATVSQNGTNYFSNDKTQDDTMESLADQFCFGATTELISYTSYVCYACSFILLPKCDPFVVNLASLYEF